MKGETIHTENSYKFTQEKIKQFADSTSLTVKNIFTDEKKWFTLVLYTLEKLKV